MEAVALVLLLSCDTLKVVLESKDCVSGNLPLCGLDFGLNIACFEVTAELLFSEATLALGCELAGMGSTPEGDRAVNRVIAGAIPELVLSDARLEVGCVLILRLSVLERAAGPVPVIMVAVFKLDGGVEPNVCASEPLPGVGACP